MSPVCIFHIAVPPAWLRSLWEDRATSAPSPQCVVLSAMFSGFLANFVGSLYPYGTLHTAIKLVLSRGQVLWQNGHSSLSHWFVST